MQGLNEIEMKNLLKFLLFSMAALLSAATIEAQPSNQLKLTLIDASNGEPVPFATVSLTKEGASKVYKYTLSSENGEVTINDVDAGTYKIKAELMGYKNFEKKVSVKGSLSLGEVKMQVDAQMLDAAQVTAVGNNILIKKDTIEYNANAFKTTENDVLEDLLKKLPGVEVGDDGSVTVNGQTIKKITIDGKTFFLDDPQLATKNIPAKIVNKVKVIEKKSEQAEFTGIDDGEEEHVIDLNIKPGMMKGVFGNIMGGGGLDIPSTEINPDARYQTAGFLGKFTDKSQISVILNGNNTNNRGFNDMAGSMMGNMRGGGGGMGRRNGSGGRGGNGITTSWMAGANGAWDLFDDKMDLGGNYLFNFTDKNVLEKSKEIRYLDGSSSNIYDSQGSDNTIARGHRFGVRLEHKFSENTSIIFEPQFNFGSGQYHQVDTTITYGNVEDDDHKLNSSRMDNVGYNQSLSTSGFLLFRQRLGIPGRTLTVMSRYSYSDNSLDGTNYSNTRYYDIQKDSLINQAFTSKSNASSVMGRVTYTEPVGGNFYIEANYAVNWNKNTSDKITTDLLTGKMAYEYSNTIVNESTSQTIGANLMYQREKSRFQVGLSAIPTTTTNNTTRYDSTTGKYEPLDPYKSTIWKWAPQAMVWWEMSESANARLFYRGSSQQPDIAKLMPVPDNTNPNNISFGNPTLNPYFSHNIRGDVRFNNKKNFSSFNIDFDGGFVQDPIVSAIWYGQGGKQYSMPFNGPTSGNANMFTFVNAPLGKSKFTIMNMFRAGWSVSSSYLGKDIDMSTYETKGYYAFMEEFVEHFKDEEYRKQHIELNTTNNLNIMERLRFMYRADNLELTCSGRTRINTSWYSVTGNVTTTTTFNNQVNAGVNWTWDAPGLTIKGDCNYNWYNGYTTPQDPEIVFDAEIQKLLFKKRVTLALKGYDIFGQAKNLNVSDTANNHSETLNNTLGRYIILSVTYRFGTFDKSKMRGPGGMGGGPMGRGPMGPPRM